MNKLFGMSVFLIIVSIIWALPTEDDKCKADNCKTPNCRCYKQDVTLDLAKRPQIVLISSDDAVTDDIYKAWYQPLYFNRTNPNNCTIGLTLFVPHEYTNYEKVHALYAKGFEIAVNSITKEYMAEYWQNADTELLTKEFLGQKQIIAKFAKINETDIRGLRTPLLQLNGDNTFEAIEKAGLVYDNTWTTLAVDEWPYTLDYKSSQKCLIGKCPEKAHKGKWVIPIVDWLDDKKIPCATVQGCINKPKDTVDDIFNWLKSNFERTYKTNKIPFNMIINSSIFSAQKNFKAAYIKFLDYLATLKDVFIVNHWQAIQWIQNPKEFSNKDAFPCIAAKPHKEDLGIVCPLSKDEEWRYMTIYNEKCPAKYPWLDNPQGN